MVHKTKASKQPTWYQDTDYSPTDIGMDSKVWKTSHKGFFITVYPCKLINKTVEGWEYELWNEKKGVEWDSWIETYSGHHAPDSETARRWAVNTVNEWK